MSILNYFLIGLIFSFLVDFMLSLESFKNHPKTKNAKWGWGERICGILIWPIGILIFLISFLKTYFK